MAIQTINLIDKTPDEIVAMVDMSRLTEPLKEIIRAGAAGSMFKLIMEKYPYGFETLKLLDEYADLTNLITYWRKGKKSHRIEIRYSTRVVRVASESLASAVLEAIFQSAVAFLQPQKSVFIEETSLEDDDTEGATYEV